MTDEQEQKAWEALDRAGRKKAAAVLKEAGLELPYAPCFDTVLVLREPSAPVVTKTAGGIHIPDKFQEEPEPKSVGTILAGGLKALDYFRDHGYLLGDRVQVGRFAGWEKEFQLDQEGKNHRKVLQMAPGDLKGSFDLKERLYGKKPTMEIVYDETVGEHKIRPIV